ncbi:TonB-dependent receptor [Asticcacaulis machinosus]|uniref:TonB-dependent receptor n=1 Tax=Asticcacaulis machinosus TaxID=2984211 RepID=A0ABT5HLI4_9CAUL|nr:carboxypeptidase regulatory-like domain-containing protein [Asticcacaulis machinosus]MDC7677100.1 TonB-dependent receptor [Asticcacaulis machinosus]
MMNHLKYGAAASVLALMSVSAVYAQETTGGIRGMISDESGAPVANASVEILHTPTGRKVQTTTDGSGYYGATNLRVGGPYTVTVTGAGFEANSQSVAAIGIGDPAAVDIVVEKAGQVQEVVVRASRRPVEPGRTRISGEAVEMSPSLNRDIRDLARKSPYATLDPTNSDALLLGGQSNRSNAILIDGVKQGDDFGLNANGYPTQRSPISISAVEAVSVDVAPFDTQYGFFQGGVVNVVTKSGGNDFHGGLFYEKLDDSLRGDSYVGSDGVARSLTSKFEEKTWGAQLSGPIIKDKLFFFASYEDFEGAEPTIFGPSDSSAATKIPGVTTANITRITDILKTKYNFDPLGYTADELAYTDVKKQVKLDWQINDNHRAVASWQETLSERITDTGNTSTGSTPSLGLLSKWYTLQSNLKTYKLQLFSDWNESFSTEVSVSRKEVVNISNPLGGDDFAEFRVYIAGGTGSSVYAGPDISRQANALTNDVDNYRVRGTYRWNDHTFTAGYEREEVEIFNLFVQRATGQYVFNSIDDLDNKRAASVQYSNAASNDKNDGAAQFGYAVNTVYVQDEWRLKPNLTVKAGIRHDWYESDDKSKYNPSFAANYGFRNDKNLNGLNSFQPRISFNWRPEIDTGLTVYGGIGKFQGGSPNVWISNSYSNPGNLTGSVTCNRTGTTSVANCGSGVNLTGVLDNVDGFNVAQAIKDRNTISANAGTGNVNAIAPDFDLAQIWKTSIGVQKRADLGVLGEDWLFRVEYLKTKVDKALYWYDVYLEKAQTGTAPDGRPTFFATTVNGAARTNRQDVVLASTDKGEAQQIMLAVSKSWNDGWARGLNMDVSYTRSDSKDVNSGTSSVATSSYRQNAVYSPNEAILATSNFEIKNSLNFSVNYSRKFFGDYATKVGIFGQKRSGLPYSFTYDDNSSTTLAQSGMFGEVGLYTSTDRQLLYVPTADANGNVTATSDPLVKYAAAFNVAAFNTYLQETGLIKYAGSISPRNAFKSPDLTTVDLHLAQELPAFFPNGSKLEAYLDIRNLGNLLNDEWGVLEQYSFPYFRNEVVARNCQVASCTAGTGNFYQYDSFTKRQPSVNVRSVYQVKVGVSYKF